MSPVYPSDEWIESFQLVCNNDPEFRDACASFSGKMLWQIEEEPGKLPRSILLFSWPDHGYIREAQALGKAEDRPDVEYIITGKYSVWKAIVKGELEPVRALITRKVKLTKGSQMKLLKQVRMAMRMMKNCSLVQTQFFDEVPRPG